jgi:hypothetical protein
VRVWPPGTLLEVSIDWPVGRWSGTSWRAGAFESPARGGPNTTSRLAVDQSHHARISLSLVVFGFARFSRALVWAKEAPSRQRGVGWTVLHSLLHDHARALPPPLRREKGACSMIPSSAPLVLRQGKRYTHSPAQFCCSHSLFLSFIPVCTALSLSLSCVTPSLTKAGL